MKVTVSQINAHQVDDYWNMLSEHLNNQPSDIVLLPEMPFTLWFATQKEFNPITWQHSVETHAAWLERFDELNTKIVAGTIPINHRNKRLNAAFVWSKQIGLQLVHEKTYLPNEPDFWEANWYERGKTDFQSIEVAGVRVGFLICTELWFFQHAREYGKQGVHLLLCPRSTGLQSVEKWITGGQSAAVVSGAFCLSSNNYGRVDDLELGGTGWIIAPDGKRLGTTSDTQPFLTMDINIQDAEQAKQEYPRYVIDTPITD